MDKTIKRIAWVCASAVLFVMSLVGWFCGQQAAICAWRGFVGAVVMYASVRIAGAVILHVMIAAAVENEVKKASQGERN